MIKLFTYQKTINNGFGSHFLGVLQVSDATANAIYAGKQKTLA